MTWHLNNKSFLSSNLLDQHFTVELDSVCKDTNKKTLQVRKRLLDSSMILKIRPKLLKENCFLNECVQCWHCFDVVFDHWSKCSLLQDKFPKDDRLHVKHYLWLIMGGARLSNLIWLLVEHKITDKVDFEKKNLNNFVYHRAWKANFWRTERQLKFHIKKITKVFINIDCKSNMDILILF